jgi:hypothetical protein
MSILRQDRCGQRELTSAYALQVLPASEVAGAEAHIASCPDCQRELESLRPVLDRFVSWPTDVLRPPASLQARLAHRIAEETGKQSVLPPASRWLEPDWSRLHRGSNASCSPPTRTGTASACWCGSRPVRTTRRIPMQAWKSCICSTASCGSTSASSSPATTTTVRPGRATSGSGANQAVPACLSPALRIPFAKGRDAPHAGRGRLSNHLNIAPIQELAFHVYGGMCTRFPQAIDEWFCGETTSTAAELVSSDKPVWQAFGIAWVE